ncbi:hypothetical protein BGX28_004924 [Mortierella sp. GBA30]|nr:hypothetical protein BGX28_004924 [Mortierella sp. GBA30]
MDTNRNPIQLPEVLALIAQHLVDRKDLARCTLVSSLWRACFEPFFWAEIKCTWCMECGLYSLMQLGSHKFGFVRSLDLNIKYILGRPDIAVFPNLETLALRNISFGYHKIFVVDCLRKHQSIRHLRLGSVHRYSVLPEVIAQLDKMPSLNELQVSGGIIEQSDAAAFYRVCSRVQVLKLSYLILRTTPTLAEAKEWRVRELTLLEVVVCNFPLHKVTDLIGSCLELQCLDWRQQGLRSRSSDSPLPEFLRLATVGTWPLLNRLVLSLSGVLDRHWATILNPLKQLKMINAQGSAFGGLSFNALRPHLGTLEELDLSCTEVTSRAMVEILCSCSRLRVLKGVPLLAKDVISDKRPWACHMIEELHLAIDISPCPGSSTPDGSENECLTLLIYEKLSQLQQLRILALRWLHPEDTPACHLNKGFYQLKTLKS